MNIPLDNIPTRHLSNFLKIVNPQNFKRQKRGKYIEYVKNNNLENELVKFYFFNQLTPTQIKKFNIKKSRKPQMVKSLYEKSQHEQIPVSILTLSNAQLKRILKDVDGGYRPTKAGKTKDARLRERMKLLKKLVPHQSIIPNTQETLSDIEKYHKLKLAQIRKLIGNRTLKADEARNEFINRFILNPIDNTPIVSDAETSSDKVITNVIDNVDVVRTENENIHGILGSITYKPVQELIMTNNVYRDIDKQLDLLHMSISGYKQIIDEVLERIGEGHRRDIIQKQFFAMYEKKVKEDIQKMLDKPETLNQFVINFTYGFTSIMGDFNDINNIKVDYYHNKITSGNLRFLKTDDVNRIYNKLLARSIRTGTKSEYGFKYEEDRDISELLDEAADEIDTGSVDNEEIGSKVRIAAIPVSLTMNIAPIRNRFQTGYIPLPEHLKRKHSLINPVNKDNACVLWCLLLNEIKDITSKGTTNEILKTYAKHHNIEFLQIDKSIYNEVKKRLEDYEKRRVEEKKKEIENKKDISNKEKEELLKSPILSTTEREFDYIVTCIANYKISRIANDKYKNNNEWIRIKKLKVDANNFELIKEQLFDHATNGKYLKYWKQYLEGNTVFTTTDNAQDIVNNGVVLRNKTGIELRDFDKLCKHANRNIKMYTIKDEDFIPIYEHIAEKPADISLLLIRNEEMYKDDYTIFSHAVLIKNTSQLFSGKTNYSRPRRFCDICKNFVTLPVDVEQNILIE